jgi:hypothetical protein
MTSSSCIDKALACIDAGIDTAAVALVLRDLYDRLIDLGADDAAEGVAAQLCS